MLRTLVLWTVLCIALGVTSFVLVTAPGSTDGVVVVDGNKVLSLLITSEAIAAAWEFALRVDGDKVPVFEVDVDIKSDSAAPPAVMVTVSAAFPCPMTKFGAMLIAACLSAQLQPSIGAGDGKPPKANKPGGALL